MEDKRPKTLRGGTLAKMYIGAPKPRKEAPTRSGVWRGDWGTPENGGRSPLVGDEASLCVGGCFLTGAELNGINELVRPLHDVVKPKLYYAYDRYAHAYLRMPT